MGKENYYNNRISYLEGGKAKALGFWEKLDMWYKGFVDGNEKLLRSDEEGNWKSCILKEEIDSYEEYSAAVFARLKMDEEENFKSFSVACDKITPVQKALVSAKERLLDALDRVDSSDERKEGEESLSDIQVKVRRKRERERYLAPYKAEVRKYEQEMEKHIDNIFSIISQITEGYESAVSIVNRHAQHVQRRIDVYWRSAMMENDKLPPVADVKLTCESDALFKRHLDEMIEKAEKLRKEFEYISCREE